MEKNLTQGSVLKNIMYFALPYLLSYFLQQLYGMADLYMIGMFGGVDGTTAVTNWKPGYVYCLRLLSWDWPWELPS